MRNPLWDNQVRASNVHAVKPNGAATAKSAAEQLKKIADSDPRFSGMRVKADINSGVDSIFKILDPEPSMYYYWEDYVDHKIRKLKTLGYVVSTKEGLATSHVTGSAFIINVGGVDEFGNPNRQILMEVPKYIRELQQQSVVDKKGAQIANLDPRSGQDARLQSLQGYTGGIESSYQ